MNRFFIHFSDFDHFYIIDKQVCIDYNSSMVKIDKKYQRYADIAATFASGVFSFIVGVVVLKADLNDYYLFIYLTASLLMITSLLHIINGVRKKDSRKDFFVRALIEFVCSVIILTFPKIPLQMLSVIFCIYMFLTSLVYLINYFLMKKQHIKDKSLLISILSFMMSIAFFISFKAQRILSVYFIGGYFLLWGFSMMMNALIDLFFRKIDNPKIRLCLPAIIDCVIPSMWLNRINRYYNETKHTEILEVRSNEPSDLQVLIHASHNGFNSFGHVDLMFEGTIYSYGNYDGRSERFFTMIGDGVMFKTTDRDAYIKFCLKRCHKTLFVYGLRLNEEQKQIVRDHINQINQIAIPWDPEFVHRPLDKNAPSIDLHVHQIYNEAKGKLYKFSQGPFKTYDVLSSNCVRFADMIIGKNIVILKMVGFITPGTYLDYFEGEYKRSSSNVVSKDIYSIYNYDIGEEDENDPYKDFD